MAHRHRDQYCVAIRIRFRMNGTARSAHQVTSLCAVTVRDANRDPQAPSPTGNSGTPRAQCHIPVQFTDSYPVPTRM
eukprot:6071095-Prymnesium_polylepis.1